MIGTTVLLLAIEAYASVPVELNDTSEGIGPTRMVCRTVLVAMSTRYSDRSLSEATTSVLPSGLTLSLNGVRPTVIGEPAVRVVASIGTTVSDHCWVTYTVLPSGVIASPLGPSATGT